MGSAWGPSSPGRFFTGASRWSLKLFGDSPNLELTVDGRPWPLSGDRNVARILVQRGLLWSVLTLNFPGERPVRLKGVPNRKFPALETAVNKYNAAQGRIGDIKAFKGAWEPISAWCGKATALFVDATVKRRWLTSEEEQALLQARPAVDMSIEELQRLSREPHVHASLSSEPLTVDLEFWSKDCSEMVAGLNREHVEKELVELKDLFDRVEKSPLTEEQARAVVCFDNRVQVVASAGSGKTSTMATKAVYAVHREFCQPGQILMLAFNEDAARELEMRTTAAFGRIGHPGARVEGRTFHSIGLSIIGKVTGRKPKVPGWAKDMPEGVSKLVELVDELKDRSPVFRSRWDLFRLVFGRDLPQFGDDSEPDAWDKDGTGQVLTLRGELVKSQEECTICDWLFYNGVDYVYEQDYEYDTATADHRQYAPDFFYPAIGLYHEHLR